MQTMTTRNAQLGDLVEMLKNQNARKHDLVVPATRIESVGGVLVVSGEEPEITMDGVTEVNGRYVPTDVCDEGISAKLNIPRAYLRRMRETRPDLYDANVNGWLHGHPLGAGLDSSVYTADPDSRKFLLRTFKGDDGQEGIARAFLSDTYKMIDNLDVLMAALDGIRDAGLNVEIDGGDLTDRRMMLRVIAPEVKALAPVLLRGYRSPFTGQYGDANPTVFAGFVISNSEVGGGAYSITPRMVVEVCKNGMTITKDALRNVHLGSRMDEGVVRWSDETQERNLALVKSQTTDAVKTFLDVDYMTEVITSMGRKAEEKVDTVEEVREITKACKFTEEQVDSVMSFFIRGGQASRAGVANAITAAAQEVNDGDLAAEMEEAAAGVLL